MTKILEVNCCTQCFFYDLVKIPEKRNMFIDYCNKLEEEITLKNLHDIAENCPLETKEDYVESNFDIDKNIKLNE